MADANDMELVRQFARHNSETAFAELVQRHINLVYSVALRFTGGSADAQDVTQAVFIILARKAAGMPARTVLTGWLYETTRFTAMRLLRTQTRRHAHEQEAFMQSTLDQSGDDPMWRQLAPHLEAGMSRLAERDRTLLALRFYENKTGVEAAAMLGIREEAAHKRTARALEKLRKFFSKRGVALSAAAIAGAVSANSVQAAPLGLAKTISAVAIAKGAAASASTLTLVKGTMKTMSWLKLKFALIVSMAVVIGGGAVIVMRGESVNSATDKTGTNTNREQILITTAFYKVPTSSVESIISDFSGPQIPIDPNSAAFQNLLNQHPGVEFFGAPRIITFSGSEAAVSITKPVQIDGTNAETGVSVNVNPTIETNSKVSMKVEFELHELVNTVPPTIRTTKQAAQTLPFKMGETTLVLRQTIGSQTIGKKPNDGAETLLMFLNAKIQGQ